MRKLTSLALALALTLTACSGQSSYYTQSAQSWRGSNIAALEAAWGKPFETVAHANGSKLYVYRRQSMTTPRNYSPQIGIANPERPVTVITAMPDASKPTQAYCLISFTANAKGTIIATDIQGTDCQISSSGAKHLEKP